MKLNWSEASDYVDLTVASVHVWAVSLEVDQQRLRGLESQLTAEERHRAGRFMRDEPRRNFIASRAALRSILGRYLETPPQQVPIVCNPYGKPHLTDAAAERGLQFNLAHAGDLALVAATYDCDVGVDVEMLRPIEHWREIAIRFFNPGEADAIAAADPSDRNAAFLHCWTRKEAILKAVGVGLGQSLKSFAVPIEDCVDAQIGVTASQPSAAGSQFWLQSLAPSPDYVAAVATKSSKRTVTGLVYVW